MYIRSYGYGGFNSMPQYGFGSWLGDRVEGFGDKTGINSAAEHVGLDRTLHWADENKKKIAGGAAMVAGAVLTPFVPPAGMALGAAGGGLMKSGQADDAKDSSKTQQSQQQQQQAAYQTDQQLAQLTNSRLGQLNQQDPNMQSQYQSFAEGGEMNNPEMKFTGNYNNPQAYRTQGGQDYYLLRNNEAFANDPNVKQFAPGYSYATDPKYAYQYGNVQPKHDTINNKVYFPSTWQGESDMFKKAAAGNYSMDELASLPQTTEYANGGVMGDADNNPDVTYFANGGTHEQNKYGGIPIGNKGKVEEGELKVKIDGKDYIFSNRF